MIAVFGPTASGKSRLAIDLATKYNGEIINMDSMQIYKYLNIGTAKPSIEEFEAAPHHLFDYVDPRDEYSVYDYKRDALKVIKKIKDRGKLPILVGGTGLYLSSLYYDFEFRQKRNEDITEKSTEEIYDCLSNELKEKIDKNNRHRIINAYLTDFVYSEKTKKRSELDISIVYTDMPRDVLYERINKRVDIMIEMGLVDEVKTLLNDYSLNENHKSMKAIGYKEVISYLKGETTFDDMVELIKRNTRRYAKRQVTWARNQYDNIHIFDITNYNVNNIGYLLNGGNYEK